MDKQNYAAERRRICDEFNRRRKKKRMTWVELSILTGVPKSTLHNWFGCGEIKESHFEFLIAMKFVGFEIKFLN